MVPIVGFCGASGSGKTTLVSGVIAELTSRGLAVGAIKHHGHATPIEEPARLKDSHRLARAGARRVALVHAGGLELAVGSQEGDWTPEQVAREFMSGLDLVLVEGFKRAAIDKIEVFAPGKDPWLPQGGRLLALATPGGGEPRQGLAVLDADNIPQVAEFVLEQVRVPRAKGVSLKVNGKELELNPFVGAFLASTLRGLVSTLKGGEQAGEIEVRIEA